MARATRQQNGHDGYGYDFSYGGRGGYYEEQVEYFDDEPDEYYPPGRGRGRGRRVQQSDYFDGEPDEHHHPPPASNASPVSRSSEGGADLSCSSSCGGSNEVSGFSSSSLLRQFLSSSSPPRHSTASLVWRRGEGSESSGGLGSDTPWWRWTPSASSDPLASSLLFVPLLLNFFLVDPAKGVMQF